MPRFDLGKLVMTTGIQSVISEKPSYQFELINYLSKYLSGDWGDLCEEDKQANETALKENERILATYLSSNGKIYIITESDRSCTTILFASEY